MGVKRFLSYFILPISFINVLDYNITSLSIRTATMINRIANPFSK